MACLSRSRARTRGLTLIELLVVMVIMTLMAAAAVPSMVAAFREARIRSATRQVVSLLHYARSRAVTSRSVARFNLKQPEDELNPRPLAWVSVQEANEETGESEFVADTKPSGRLRQLPEGITLEVVKRESEEQTPAESEDPETEEGVSFITFWRNGQTQDAVIQLVDEYKRRTQKTRYIRLEAIMGRPKLISEKELAKDELADELE